MWLIASSHSLTVTFQKWNFKQFLAHRLTGAGSRKYVYPIIELSAMPPEKLFRFGLNEIMKACIDCIVMKFSELRKPRVHS